VDLRETRIKRLQQFAQRHGAEENPSLLGELIGKKPNQVYNLLNRHASFGEKVARSIEEAAGLPKGWLDAEEEAVTGLSPEVSELASAIEQLPPKWRDWAILNLREAVKLAREMVTEDAVGTDTSDAEGQKIPASSQRRKAA
jgi:hypothetical protein